MKGEGAAISNMNTLARSALVGLVVLARAASATTWVVDPAGGPGVDFTDIAAAAAAAAPGDVILVHPGSYAGFTLGTGVSIVGGGGVTVTGHIRLQGIPAGPRASLANLSTRAIEVRQCAAPVTLEDVVV